MELWTPQVPSHRQHPNYVRATAESMASARELISKWAIGFQDLDGKFVKEFQTTFNSSFWELYLNAVFRELGYQPQCQPRPDFLLQYAGEEVLVEATIAQHPDGFMPEWQGQLDPESLPHFDVEELLSLASIRLANSIVSKHRKYVNEYQKLKYVAGKPFVIALAPFEQPLFWVQRDRALRRVLYLYDAPIAQSDHENQEHHVYGHAFMESATKHTGAQVSFGLFTNEQYSEVSAVVFSSCATWGKVRAMSGTCPESIFRASRYNDEGTQAHDILELGSDYKESLLDGFHVFVNPYADYPLSLDIFKGREVAVHQLASVEPYVISDLPEGFLFERVVMTPTTGAEADDLRARVQRSPYVQSVPTWPERVLHPCAGYAYTFTDSHLAHYRGHTILVSRDKIDNDWGTLATPGLHKTVPAFVSANSASELGVILPGWFNTKEVALNAMCKHLDEEPEA
ncbi:MAG: hypothetical protein ACI8X5_003322 [Planctomycetota bacterium]|jgi:hypothetical protein